MSARHIVDSWLRSAQAERNLSPKSLKAYRCDALQLARYLKSRAITSLRPTDLREYVLFMRSQGLRDATIRRRAASLRVLFNWLEAEGLVPRSPLRDIRLNYRYERRLPRVIPLSHVQTLLVVASGQASRTSQSQKQIARSRRNRAMIELLFATGIRSEELVRMDVEDLDLERETIRIHGKGRREREVCLSAQEVVTALQSYLAVRRELHPDGSALFLNRFGVRLGVQSVRSIFRALQRSAGLPENATPHMLRHTMATMLVENGADVRSTQEILGHSSIRTTQLYLEVSRQRQRAVMTQFNARNSISVRPGVTQIAG